MSLIDGARPHAELDQIISQSESRSRPHWELSRRPPPGADAGAYRIGATVVMEERSDGILLRPPGSVSPKLSWEETAREMATEAEDWGAWDVTVADGLDEVPWEAAKSRVAERGPKYRPRSRGKR